MTGLTRAAEARLMRVSPELVESVLICVEHLPHVEVSGAGFEPLLQLAVVRIAGEPHDELNLAVLRSKAADVNHSAHRKREEEVQ